MILLSPSRRPSSVETWSAAIETTPVITYRTYHHVEYWTCTVHVDCAYTCHETSEWDLNSPQATPENFAKLIPATLKALYGANKASNNTVFSNLKIWTEIGVGNIAGHQSPSKSRYTRCGWGAKCEVTGTIWSGFPEIEWEECVSFVLSCVGRDATSCRSADSPGQLESSECPKQRIFICFTFEFLFSIKVSHKNSLMYWDSTTRAASKPLHWLGS